MSADPTLDYEAARDELAEQGSGRVDRIAGLVPDPFHHGQHHIDPDQVAPLLPRGTTPDVHDGSAWVGLVPFVLSEFLMKQAPGYVPPPPWHLHESPACD